MAFFKRKSEEEKKKTPLNAEPVAIVSSKKKDKVKTKEKNTKNSVLLKVLVTEKIAHLSDKGMYGFEVPQSATKIMVAKAVKAKYGVMPRLVNIMNVRGKWVRYGRNEGQRSDWKKAMVFLKKGEHIDVNEGV